MRFVSFNYIDRFPRAGVLLGEAVIDLAAAAPLMFEQADGQRWELLDILRGAPEGMGIGLRNVSDRLATRFPGDAACTARIVAPGRLRTQLDLPVPR